MLLIADTFHKYLKKIALLPHGKKTRPLSSLYKHGLLDKKVSALASYTTESLSCDRSRSRSHVRLNYKQPVTNEETLITDFSDPFFT